MTAHIFSSLVRLLLLGSLVLGAVVKPDCSCVPQGSEGMEATLEGREEGLARCRECIGLH